MFSARPEDFIVTEIDTNGQLVTLNKDVQLTPPPKLDQMQSSDSSDEDEICLDPILTPEQESSLKELSQNYEATPPTTPFTSTINLGSNRILIDCCMI